MEQRQKEWREHETQATYLLEHPHLLPEQKGLGKFQLALRLWHYPAFEPYTVWLVYRGENCLLREVIWDRQTDANRILDPLEGLKYGFQTIPSFRIRSVELVGEEIDRRLSDLKRISLPVFIQSNTIGLDGETFGITIGNGFLNAQVSWWCKGPQEWHEATAWFQQTTEYFVASLAEDRERD